MYIVIAPPYNNHSEANPMSQRRIIITRWWLSTSKTLADCWCIVYWFFHFLISENVGSWFVYIGLVLTISGTMHSHLEWNKIRRGKVSSHTRQERGKCTRNYPHPSKAHCSEERTRMCCTRQTNRWGANWLGFLSCSNRQSNHWLQALQYFLRIGNCSSFQWIFWKWCAPVILCDERRQSKVADLICELQ